MTQGMIDRTRPRLTQVARATAGRVAGSIALASALTVCPCIALSGNFSVAPVRVLLTPKDRAVAITLENGGAAPVALQADIYDWKQNDDGSDKLALSEDLVVSPPIIKLPPFGRQVVRLARLVPADMSRQLTYRLLINEVPEVAASAASSAGIVVQLPMAMTLSLPVFVTPPAAKPAVSCVLEHADGMQRAGQARPPLTARCSNTGNAFTRIRSFSVTRDQVELARFEGATYILPGRAVSLELSARTTPAAGPALASVLLEDGNTVELPVQVPAPPAAPEAAPANPPVAP